MKITLESSPLQQEVRRRDLLSSSEGPNVFSPHQTQYYLEKKLKSREKFDLKLSGSEISAKDFGVEKFSAKNFWRQKIFAQKFRGRKIFGQKFQGRKILG